MFPAEQLEAAPPARPSFLLQLIKYIENHLDEKFAATEHHPKILPVISFSCMNPNKGALYFILALIKKDWVANTHFY